MLLRRDVRGRRSSVANGSTAAAPDGTLTFRGKLLTYDGVHANARGNELLANLIAQGLVEALTGKP